MSNKISNSLMILHSPMYICCCVKSPCLTAGLHRIFTHAKEMVNLMHVDIRGGGINSERVNPCR